MYSRGAYFEGLYFKHQGQSGVVALIPALHRDRAGRLSATLQVIAGEHSFCAQYPKGELLRRSGAVRFRVGDSVFSEKGCTIDIAAPEGDAYGVLRYGPWTPPAYDIMGPFAFVPCMQCRHSVLSLKHSVEGELRVNGRKYVFENGLGYVEGDRGRSFPRRYLWCQCGWENGCAMVSVADIPLAGLRFTGCIASVLLNGWEYRLSTYQGAKVECIDDRRTIVRQGTLRLSCTRLDGESRTLRAPAGGVMGRTIREAPCCRVHVRLEQGGAVLLDRICDQAGFEGEWGTTIGGQDRT